VSSSFGRHTKKKDQGTKEDEGADSIKDSLDGSQSSLAQGKGGTPGKVRRREKAARRERD